MLQPGRKYSGGSGYRFGFNGKENDKEVKSDGNNIDFGNRVYDTRLGKWLSIDPFEKKYTSYSPFNYCMNNPVKFVDILGEFVVDPEFKKAYPTVALLLENADKIYFNQELPADVIKALGNIDSKKVFTDLFRNTFKDISKASDDEIKEILKNGSGPLIRSWFDQCTEDGEECYNGKWFPPKESGLKVPYINISPEIAAVLEFELKKDDAQDFPYPGSVKGVFADVVPDDGDAQVAFRVFFATIFHEVVHDVREKKGIDVDIEFEGGKRHNGKVFEIKVFGRDQGRLRVKELRKKNDKPRSEKESDKYNRNWQEDIDKPKIDTKSTKSSSKP